jgi:sugar/nucleoside kinase (ribokinase family)
MRPGAHLEGVWLGARLGGGAASTAAALALAGHHATVIAAVGDDPIGRELLDALAATGVDVSQVRRVHGDSTRSLVMVDEVAERTIVNLCRAREPEPPRRLLELTADCLYVRSRSLDLAPLLAQKASSCLVVAHLPPVERGCRPAHVLVASAQDLDPGDREHPWDVGHRVAGERLEWVVLTRGADGAEAFGSGQTLRAPAPKVKAVDTTGAGDAFAAGLVHELVRGASMRSALEAGARWGARAAQADSSVLPPEAIAALVSGE